MAKVMKTMDGNAAAAYSAYAFTEVAGIYPITPSSQMAENLDEWSANGKKNIFGETVNVVEMQSEAGAAGAVHGSLQAGALTTTFTASQGLLLKIPNMYKIAGELLPCVIHVSARAIASHALSIFGDHSDVMAARQTGFAMLASNSVQEVVDLAAVAHLSTLKSRVPFLHFFDGFRTSHEIQKIEVLDYDDYKEMLDMDAVQRFRDSALNPNHAVTRGSAQNPDIFFQGREASNKFYDELPEIVEDYMNQINKKTGRNYQLFNYYGAQDADRIIIAMGSGVEAMEETVDYLNAQGQKVGLIKVRLYRPFSLKHFIDTIPASVQKIAVLDRTKEPGSLGEPLYQDVCTALLEADRKIDVVAGRYGLGSKDFTPAQVVAIFNNLQQSEPKNHFTVGIKDDVTFTSLEVGEEISDIADEATTSCKFWGLGSDGTVGANKNSIKIIGDNTDLYAQAYFSYDSKKSFGITTSHLRFGKNPIRATYLVKTADFVACHNPSYLDKYDMLADLKVGGTFLLNCSWTGEELDKNLPANVKRQLVEKKVKLYTIDATTIAREIGLGNRTNTVLQAAFFNLTQIIPNEEAVKYMKEAIYKSYSKKGDKIVEMNYQAVERGLNGATEVTVNPNWANASDDTATTKEEKPFYIREVVEPVNAQKGDDLPVSTFMDYVDGTMPNGTSAYEKRGIAVEVPKWIHENCIQCNQCSYVCPHSCIRPVLVSEDNLGDKPDGFETIDARGKGFEGLKYRIQVSTLDCTGCGDCVSTCPSKEKSLVMEPIESQMPEMENWYYSLELPKVENPANKETVKGSQFEQPLFEFSGACAGCGETPYAKLITQLFGDRMYIANATGCSSIWGASAPATPYTTNKKGQGPAWANSLFEDNAEFGYGMYVGYTKVREGLRNKLSQLADSSAKDAIATWNETYKDGEANKKATVELISALEAEGSPLAKEVLKEKDFLGKKSQWILGGDGWAYDIGYGGLDHVLASGENVNILVFDTEVYSNTGGQSSKASPTASVAKFAAAGKRIRKKDLGMMAMTYEYVYVAQVGMGANQSQLIKAMIEAEKYDGPSLIIAYAPCIAHGVKGGLIDAQARTKKAVECGYWHLYRYNPSLHEENKNPFTLDSKEPNGEVKEFILEEARYTSLQRAFPDVAEELFDETIKDCNRRYASYKRMQDAKY